MLRFCILVLVTLCMTAGAPADSLRVDPSSFNTTAKFSVDNNVMTLSSAVAILEPRPGAPGYYWLRITFYSFPLTAADVAGVVSGNIDSLERKWSATASNPKQYNNSHAVIQLTVDSAFKVWQVDMFVPGYGSTIAPSEPDVKNFLQTYQFDGKRLNLKSKGSYVPDTKSAGVPNHKFGWDIDLDLPVFRKAPSRK